MPLPHLLSLTLPLLLLVSSTLFAAQKTQGLTRCGVYRATGELLFEKKQPILRIYGFSQKEVILYIRGTMLQDPARLFGQLVVLTGRVHNLRDFAHGDMEVSVMEQLPIIPQMVKDHESVDSLTLIKPEKCGRNLK